MSLRRKLGITWLAFWLVAAGSLAYRAATHDTAGEAVASVGSRADRAAGALKPIERIEVGDRVASTINPTEGFDDSLGAKIHPHAWRRIELRPDEHSRVVLLRPEWWVNERIQADDQTISISIPEVGIQGDARIVSVDPCPAIPQGEGRVVIGTFSHRAPSTIRLTVDGIAEPIRCTPNHATWSVEARDFIEAQDLEPGTHVLCEDGIREVTAVEPLSSPIEVFNLEVHGQHVYQITTGGMLVHNAGPAGSGSESVKPPISGPIQPYNQAKKAKTPGFDNHHLDPPLGRSDPNYPAGPTIGVRNDNAGGKVPGGVNLHTAKGGFQTALREHITKDLGITIKDWNSLSDSVRQLHLRRYYASFGIPFPG